MSRNSTERPKYKKYDYKTHHTSFTQRSESLNRHDPLSSSRKTSALKTRKDSTENSIIHHEPAPFEDIRLPLGEIFENSAKVARALFDPKKDGRNLRNKNAELQLKVARQAKEIEEMRSTLQGMKSKQNQELKQANLLLQARCEAQDRQMAALITQVNNLMALVVQGETFSCQNAGLLEESHISRRAEYRQNYENIANSIPKPLRSQCITINQEIQQLRIRFETQLLRTKNDHQTMLAQQEKIAQLELQLQHKNKCIDYLRQQVEEYERSSKQQVTTGFLINSNKKVRHQGRDIYVRSKPDESFNSFSDFKY